MRTEIPDHGPPAAAAETLGARIAAARRAAGLTQEQMGQKMGPNGTDLSKGAISAWEVDRTQPSAAQIVGLAARLGVDANYLLGIVAVDGTIRVPARSLVVTPGRDRRVDHATAATFANTLTDRRMAAGEG